MREMNKVDLIGRTFGRWTVLEYDDKTTIDKNNGLSYWKCVCSCENKTIKSISRSGLSGGKSNSCGCILKEKNKLNAKIKAINGNSIASQLIDMYGKDALNIYWDYDKNTVNPYEINKRTGKKVWIKCNKKVYHGSYLVSIDKLTVGSKCPYCTNKNGRVKREDSFAKYHIDNTDTHFLDNYWDYHKNKIDPWSIAPTSQSYVWIKCTERIYHESYKVKCSNFTAKSSRCPYCLSKKIHEKDSFGQYINDKYNSFNLSEIWSDKNNKTPYEYSPHSQKYAWFKCLDGVHADYKRVISSSIKYSFRCPNCINEKTESILQEKIRTYIELKYNVLHEYQCNIIATNPKNSYKLPYDNEIPELKVIIETHGIQHYELLPEKNQWLNGVTPESYLKRRKLLDRYKKIYAKSKGYKYLEIPYWSDNENNDWKMLIDKFLEDLAG